MIDKPGKKGSVPGGDEPVVKVDKYLDGDNAEAGEEVRSPKRILEYLTKALEDEELVEVEMNNRTRTFFTYFLDHIPDPIRIHAETGEVLPEDAMVEEGEEGTVVYKEVPYQPLSYLEDRDRLLIAPLVPVLGNAQIRTAQHILLRFFDGVKSMEAEVAFVEVAEVQGEPCIRLTYPGRFHIQRKRRHFRAMAAPDIHIPLAVHLPKVDEPLQLRVVDISVGGLSFATEKSAGDLPLGEAVYAVFMGADDSEIKVKGYLRNCNQASGKDGCRKGDLRWGMQFDVKNLEQAMRIESMVAFVQRRRLQAIYETKAGRRALMREKEKQNEEREGQQGRQEMKKFFKIKEKFTFK